MKRKGSTGWIALLSCLAMAFWALPPLFAEEPEGGYVVVDTGQKNCYDLRGRVIRNPAKNRRLSGQDAQYQGVQASYTDNGDGTITDIRTGLMWQKTPGKKMTHEQANAGASSFDLAGYTDWRLPTIKELYSLVDFSGFTGFSASGSKPYLNTEYFDFSYGNPYAGERFIDAQFISATDYVSTTMGETPTVFGVNFADGRIKGYGYAKKGPRGEKTFFVRYVRGNPDYGINDFVDNGDGTVSDRATGLMWMKPDSGDARFDLNGAHGKGALNWGEALKWAEGLDYGGYTDWRLPNAKELQSIVDYTRSPATTGTAAISPVFECTPVTDGNGQTNYPAYWTSTTHVEGPLGRAACYVAFGEAQGWMRFPPYWNLELMDVHGAGAQRSDPKAGNPAYYPHGRGPQGDVITIYNHVRCVRGVLTD